MRQDPFAGIDRFAPATSTLSEQVEILGPHLRVSGRVDLGRFGRLSDLVNHSVGFLLLHDARLLRRNGDPTNLVMSELMVSRDEITFLGLAAGTASPTSPATRGGRTGALDPGGLGMGRLNKISRRFVVFTPGHTITGDVHVYEEITIAAFVDASDPRFVPMTNVRARSLADRRVISHFDLLLVNRSQMIAAAEADQALAVAD